MSNRCRSAFFLNVDSPSEVCLRCTKEVGHEGYCSVTLEFNTVGVISLQPEAVSGSFTLVMINETTEEQVAWEHMSFRDAHRLKMQKEIGNLAFSTSFHVIEETEENA